ncbi:hypothetical protein [uncultured Bacteroides sp.]|uniref:hypothetical protein n=1 Tax=uncultured Bacteroides sp. TaxID=162156 RepID=UPI0025FE093B|nr:hypothetical protein [uncultured Bacteroides sp.]
MKKFLIHICLFSSVLIILSIGFEMMLRQIPNSYKFKQEITEKHGNEIKNLIIGSSVTNCSLNPAYFADSTYNLSLSGQWLRYNQVLLERYIERLPRLQNVIWGISYQTLWIDDCISQDKTSVTYHKIYMDIDRHKDLLYNIELIGTGSISFRKWSKYYMLHKRTMACDSLGLDHSFDSAERSGDWLQDIPQDAKGHSVSEGERAEQTFAENVRRLNEAAGLCRDKGIKLYFVIPPVHKLYYESANPAQVEQMHAALQEIAATWSNVRVYSYFNDSRFTDDDFHSGNHLSSDIGAPKFTRLLRQDMARADSLQAE